MQKVACGFHDQIMTVLLNERYWEGLKSVKDLEEHRQISNVAVCVTVPPESVDHSKMANLQDHFLSPPRQSQRDIATLHEPRCYPYFPEERTETRLSSVKEYDNNYRLRCEEREVGPANPAPLYRSLSRTSRPIFEHRRPSV